MLAPGIGHRLTQGAFWTQNGTVDRADPAEGKTDSFRDDSSRGKAWRVTAGCDFEDRGKGSQT